MNTKRSGMQQLATLTLITLLPLLAQAQNRFGIRAGLNVSNVSFKELPNKSERFGYHLGVFADFPLINDFMSLQPEVGYSVKGAAFKPLDKKQKLNFNYIDLYVPVAFKLGSIDVQVGPFGSLLTSSADYEIYDDDRIVEDAFKKYDIGLTVGLSYYWNSWMTGIRYDQSLVDVTKADSRALLGSGQHTVGQVSLGYRF